MNIQFIQLTDLWHVLQVTLTDIKPGKSIKKKRKKIWRKLCESFVITYQLISDAISLNLREAVRILKC